MDETVQTAVHNDLKGQMFRRKRQMPDAEAREFLRERMIAHVGAVDANRWPYVSSSTCTREATSSICTPGRTGIIFSSIPRICVEVSEIGPLHKGKRFACDSALVYASVIVFGPARILYHDREKKSWFLDRLLAKHGDPSWVFEPGYPLLDQIILYEQRIEILTGKRSMGLRH